MRKRDPIKTEPTKEIYEYRCLLVHPEFSQEKRDSFNNDLKKYKEWKEKFETTKKTFGPQDARTPEEIEEGKNIQASIIKQRGVINEPFEHEEIKGNTVEYRRNKEKLPKNIEHVEKEEDKKEPESQPIKKIIKKTTEKKHEGTQEEALGANNKSMGSEGMTGTISQISNTGEFVANYFLTKEGMEVKYDPISEEHLKELIEAAEKHKREEEAKARGEVRKEDNKEQQDVNAIDNNPIVALEPEATMNKNKESMMAKSKVITEIKPSHYHDMMQRMHEAEEKEREDAENYHISKTKDFTVSGNTRTNKPVVPTLGHPKPPTEINERNYLISTGWS